MHPFIQLTKKATGNSKLLLLVASTIGFLHSTLAQTLFNYGNSSVSKDEFVRAFNKNNTAGGDKAASMKNYLALYTQFKLKVSGAIEMKLDTSSQLKYDLKNFRRRLEDQYIIKGEALLAATGFKKNNSIEEAMLYLYADSSAYAGKQISWPHSKDVIFSLTGRQVKGIEWYSYARQYKLKQSGNTILSNPELYDQFIQFTAENYYREHLEEFNPEFRYQLQEFKESNLMYEAMSRKVWNRPVADEAALRQYYEANKQQFAWPASADVILINAKTFAYANNAQENMKRGNSWQLFRKDAEGMYQADSARYELSHLPLKKEQALSEGLITDILINDADNSASFVKIVKLYPAGEPRPFEMVKQLVINSYQQYLEESWVGELAKKYPVKINAPVFESLLK